MATLTITATSVAIGTGALVQDYYAGGTITAGQAVYLSTSNTVIAARANNADTDEVRGIALNGGASGQPIRIITAGLYTVGATIVRGGAYALAYDTAGGIAPFADILAQTGGVAYSTLLGVAVSTTQLYVNISTSSVTIA